jgi:acyl carrier protein
MDTRPVFERLQAIFRDQFDDQGLTLTRESAATNIAGWDSLMHIGLIAQIEAEFSIRFALGEIQDLNNAGEMLDLIGSKLGS